MTKPVIDMQGAIFERLKALLVGVAGFGAEVREAFVLDLIDAEDADLPEQLIVLQETSTEEGERVTPASIKEVLSISLVLMYRGRDYGPVLRAGRLAVKQALPGLKAGIEIPGVVSVRWGAETPMPPEGGRRWACRVIPLSITYTQQL